jgi:hypothetical protein
MKTVVVKVLKPFGRYAAGQTVHVAVDDDGQAIELAWRRRIKDAQLDECCVIELDNPPTRATKRRDQ